MRYLKLILFMVILIPFSVDADICDYSEKVRLQTLAQNITYSYDYVEENGNVSFTITFNNMHSDLYLINSNNDSVFNYSGEELVLGGFKDNTSYKFEVRTNNIFCNSSALYYIYITTPTYNPYYSDPICVGIEEYKYCNKWQKNPYSYKQFIEHAEDYKNSLIEQPKQEEVVKGIFDIIIDFYCKYYYIILPTVIVLGLIYIIILMIRRKRNDLF